MRKVKSRQNMEAYFLAEEERKARGREIGDVIYYKTLRCTKHAMEYAKRGFLVRFAQGSLKQWGRARSQ